MTTRLIKVGELSKRLGMSPKTIYNRHCLGTLPLWPIKLGPLLRWDEAEVEAWIEELKRKRDKN